MKKTCVILLFSVLAAIGLIFALSMIFSYNPKSGSLKMPAKKPIEPDNIPGIVVIDPGHGSKVNSRENEGTNELEIALKLRALLEAKGYKVVMTHTAIGAEIGDAKDEYDDDLARAKVANLANAKAVVRLHSDSHDEDKFSLYYPAEQVADRKGKVGPKYPETISKSLKLSQAILTSLKSAGFVPMSEPIHPDTDNTWRTNFILSANLEVPAAVTLVELYGHNNPDHMKKYSTIDEQEKIAEALSNGIEQYVKQTNLTN